MRFLHAADLHIDSALKGLRRYDGAPETDVAGATREALKNLVQTAIREKVDFVLLAGDVYDRDWKDYNTGLFFVSQVQALASQGIRVIAITGNHDAVSQITKALRLPEGVDYLNHDKSQTIKIPVLKVAIHGRGYATRWEKENLVPHYPEPVLGYFNVGLLHTSADGRATEHETYAPCSVDDLERKGYDYWALGHIHQRMALSEKPYILFPGCIQGRHIKETGPKGCTLVEVVDNDIVSVTPVELDVIRWYRCDVDAAGLDTPETVLEAVGRDLAREAQAIGGRTLAARVCVTGRTAAHDDFWRDMERWVNEVRNTATQAAPGQIWIEKVSIETRPMTAEVPEGPKAELIASVQAMQGDLKQLAADFGATTELGAINHLVARLPREAREALDLQNGDITKRLLEDVQSVLLAKLTESAPT